MKKLNLIICFALTIICLGCTQEKPSHLEFSGIVIDGSFEKFEKKLKSKGYNKLIDDNKFALFTGDFAYEDDCTIAVYKTPISQTVYEVMVIFKTDWDWIAIKNKYNKIKEKYASKYGNPSRSYDVFSYPYNEGDGRELRAITEKCCGYSSQFLLDYGEINLKIFDLQDVGDGSVAVSYVDYKNRELVYAEKNKKIANDL